MLVWVALAWCVACGDDDATEPAEAARAREAGRATPAVERVSRSPFDTPLEQGCIRIEEGCAQGIHSGRFEMPAWHGYSNLKTLPYVTHIGCTRELHGLRVRAGRAQIFERAHLHLCVQRVDAVEVKMIQA